MTTAAPSTEELRDGIERRLEHVEQEREQLRTALRAMTPPARRGRPPKTSADGQTPRRRPGRPRKTEQTNGGEPTPEPAEIVA